jgi:hypothetical protein
VLVRGCSRLDYARIGRGLPSGKAMACKAGAARIAAAFVETGPRTAADALEELLPMAERGGRSAA